MANNIYISLLIASIFLITIGTTYIIYTMPQSSESDMEIEKLIVQNKFLQYKLDIAYELENIQAMQYSKLLKECVVPFVETRDELK